MDERTKFLVALREAGLRQVDFSKLVDTFRSIILHQLDVSNYLVDIRNSILPLIFNGYLDLTNLV